jgi:N-acetylglutamate synthase-like GNAT family acetyltransferase
MCVLGRILSCLTKGAINSKIFCAVSNCVFRVEKKADNVSKVFALSRHNAQWFLKQGFVKMDISELPKKRQALFDHQRNSSVFFKIVAKENL